MGQSRGYGTRRRSGGTTRSRRASRPRRKAHRSRALPAAVRRFVVRASIVVLVFVGAYVAWLDLKVRTEFDGKRWSLPARIYARPLELFPGLELTPGELERELERIGYHKVSKVHRPGSYSGHGGLFRVSTREFRFWDGLEGPRQLTVRFERERLVELSDAQEPVDLMRLEPALIGGIYPAHHEDRILVSLDEVPRHLVDAVIAVEDRGFYRHHGISVRAIARAALANLRAGGAVQGGSTLTQQLAKNFYLEPKRTLRRKLDEALIAVLLELRYAKGDILEAYLNEVYLGQRGRRANPRIRARGSLLLLAPPTRAEPVGARVAGRAGARRFLLQPTSSPRARPRAP